MVLLSYFEDIKGQKAERKKQTNKQAAGGTVSLSIAKYFLSCISEYKCYLLTSGMSFLNVLLTKRPLRANSVVSFAC